MKALIGHDSPETAYVVDDYPYGFRLRCRIRYWIETTKHGQRLCSQTTNPKKPGEVWNKPKKSTYAPIMVLLLADNGYVTSLNINVFDDEDVVAAGMVLAGSEAFVDPYRTDTLKMLKFMRERAARRVYTIKDRVS